MAAQSARRRRDTRFGSCKAARRLRTASLASTAVVLRHLAIAAAPLLGLGLGLGHAAPAAVQLMPGVTFQQSVQLTPNGPVVLDVMTGPRPAPGGPTTLEPFLASGSLTERATLSSAERRLSAGGTYAGVNGDFFNFASGLPSGGLVAGGGVVAPPDAARSTAGVLDDGTLDVRRVALFGTWKGAGTPHPLNAVNAVPAADAIALFTSAWGAATPAIKGGIAAVVFPLPSTTPGVDLQTSVQEVVPAGSPVAIPVGGGVLLARGAPSGQLTTEAPAGTPATLKLLLQPSWPSLVSAIGGGPQIVRSGAPVFRAGEQFTTVQLGPRAARTAVGQLADGRVILVVVDGRQAGWSVGMTNFELGQALVRLGAVTGMALDSGGSSTMAFDGTVLNRPSDGAERRISTALAFVYRGAFARAALPVVSPNGDGADDAETLSVKVVEPSSVTVSLTAPDGTQSPPETSDRNPGTYPVAFPPAGSPAPAEGRWTLAVSAVDDLGRQTSMNAAFTVDDTLGFLATSVPKLFLPPGGRDVTISWKQTRAARVTVTVETKTGTIVRTAPARAFQAGTPEATWDGLDAGGKRVKGGVYVVRVSAVSKLGTVELTRTLAVRQIAKAPAGS